MIDKLLEEQYGIKEELQYYSDFFWGPTNSEYYLETISKIRKTFENLFAQTFEHVFLSNYEKSEPKKGDLWLFSKKYAITGIEYLRDKETDKNEFHIYDLAQLKTHMTMETENYELEYPGHCETNSELILKFQIDEKTVIKMEAKAANCILLVKIAKVLHS